MTTDEFFDSLPACERPVYSAQSGGYVFALHPEIGSFQSGYRPAIQALATARGINLTEDIPLAKREQMFDLVFAQEHKDSKGIDEHGEKGVLCWAKYGSGIVTSKTMRDDQLQERYEDAKSKAKKKA